MTCNKRIPIVTPEDVDIKGDVIAVPSYGDWLARETDYPEANAWRASLAGRPFLAEHLGDIIRKLGQTGVELA